MHDLVFNLKSGIKNMSFNSVRKYAYVHTHTYIYMFYEIIPLPSNQKQSLKLNTWPNLKSNPPQSQHYILLKK